MPLCLESEAVSLVAAVLVAHRGERVRPGCQRTERRRDATPIPTVPLPTPRPTLTPPPTPTLSPVTPPPPRIPTPSPTPVTYIVQEGDTPIVIANKFGVGVNDLIAVNNIDPAALPVGKVLIIPIGPQTGPQGNALLPSPTPAPYQIRGINVYRTPAGSLEVLGEVFNPGPDTLGSVQIQVSLQDEAGQGPGDGAAVSAPRAHPPERSRAVPHPVHRAAFDLQPLFDHAPARRDDRPGSQFRRPAQSPGTRARRAGRNTAITGEVTNADAANAGRVVLTIMTYDPDGRVIGYRHAVLSDGPVAPGRRRCRSTSRWHLLHPTWPGSRQWSRGGKRRERRRTMRDRTMTAPLPADGRTIALQALSGQTPYRTPLALLTWGFDYTWKLACLEPWQLACGGSETWHRAHLAIFERHGPDVIYYDGAGAGPEEPTLLDDTGESWLVRDNNTGVEYELIKKSCTLREINTGRKTCDPLGVIATRADADRIVGEPGGWGETYLQRIAAAHRRTGRPRAGAAASLARLHLRLLRLRLRAGHARPCSRIRSCSPTCATCMPRPTTGACAS